MGIYQSKNVDYKINKEQYKLLKKAIKGYAPKKENISLIYNALSIKDFVSCKMIKDKLYFFTTANGEIAVEEYEHTKETLNVSKSANTIAIISLVIASISALLSAFLTLLQLLQA